MDTSPLETEAEFERAVEEAADLAAAPPAPETPEARKLDRRLTQIAAFHDAQPPERQAANLPQLKELEQHLRAYGKRWPQPNGRADEDHHWSPMVGGDFDPAHHGAR